MFMFLGPLVLSITERCPLYRGCKNIVKVGDYVNGSSQFKCPLKQRCPLYGVSTKWRLHCSGICMGSDCSEHVISYNEITQFLVNSN